jgi:FkbM family methyltransferase
VKLEPQFLIPKLIYSLFKSNLKFGFDRYTYASCLYESKFGCQGLTFWNYTKNGLFLICEGAELFLRPFPSSDLFVFRQVFVDLQYRPLFNYFDFSNFVRPLRIIDAGANIGLSSVFFFNEIQNRLNLDVSIYAIEPDNDSFNSLVRNTASLDTKIIPKKAALWHAKTRLSLIKSANYFSEWGVKVSNELDGNGLVDTKTVAGIMEEMEWDEIDILKIDIEGSEFEVFLNRNADISFLYKVRLIAIEIHNNEGDKQAIVDVLNNYGFDVFDHGELTFALRSKNYTN